MLPLLHRVGAGQGMIVAESITPLMRSFGKNIWIVDGPVVSVAGFRYPTRMAVIRLADAGLFVWSPVALTEDLRRSVESKGDVRFIVAPNALHDRFLLDWKTAYPDAKTYAPPGVRDRRTGIVFDGDLEDTPASGWREQIDQVVVRGNLITTEVVFFHRDSQTVLFTDLIQNFPRGWFKGWRAIVGKLDRLVGAEAQVPQKFRVAFVNRGAARDALKRILAWPAENVLMAHGSPIETNGAAYIRRAFRWLTG